MAAGKKRRTKPKRRKPAPDLPEVERARDDYHVSVLLEQSCTMLVNNPNGVYIDGTLGGGGHSARILSLLGPQGRLIAYDADVNAIAHCRERFAEELSTGANSRLVLKNENFSKACSIEEELGLPCTVHGLLLDLGVSSRQLDTESIGLSYRVDSRLDMRFGPHGRSAEDVLATFKEEELERILRQYGEEPYARRIARRLAASRRAAPLRTTFDLRREIEAVTPPQHHLKTLSRVFQALRIAVNNELQVLEDTLRGVIPMLAAGGRIVVISYHSLEDRIVKNIFKDASAASVPDPDNPRSGVRPVHPQLRILSKRPVLPDPAEIARNPRARSAKMRVAEKTEEPGSGSHISRKGNNVKVV